MTTSSRCLDTGVKHPRRQETGNRPQKTSSKHSFLPKDECLGTETTGRMAGHAEDGDKCVCAVLGQSRGDGVKREGWEGGYNHAYPPGRHTVRMFACDPAGRALCGAFGGHFKWVPRHLTHSARWHRTERRTSNL